MSNFIAFLMAQEYGLYYGKTDVKTYNIDGQTHFEIEGRPAYGLDVKEIILSESEMLGHLIRMGFALSKNFKRDAFMDSYYKQKNKTDLFDVYDLKNVFHDSVPLNAEHKRIATHYRRAHKLLENGRRLQHYMNHLESEAEETDTLLEKIGVEKVAYRLTASHERASLHLSHQIEKAILKIQQDVALETNLKKLFGFSAKLESEATLGATSETNPEKPFDSSEDTKSEATSVRDFVEGFWNTSKHALQIAERTHAAWVETYNKELHHMFMPFDQLTSEQKTAWANAGLAAIGIVIENQKQGQDNGEKK